MPINEYGPSESVQARVARHQRIRRRRLGISCISYALQIASVIIISALGGMSSWLALSYAASLVAIVAALYVAFRTGWNLRWREPNLTLLQVLMPALPSFVLLYYLDSPQAQAGLALTLVVPLLYGILDLTRTGFMVAAVTYCAGFMLVIFGRGLLHVSHGILSNNWILFASLLAVMAQIALLGALVNRLHCRLHKRNQQIREAMGRLSEMAVRDDLTGLYNRRRLMAMLEHEHFRIERGDYRFCVALIDIDHFKHVNDTYGHTVGDGALRTLAGLMADNVREIDVLGRFGGEEFLWVMPDTHMTHALEAAERVRAQAAAQIFTADDGSRFSITLSIGLAQSDSHLKLDNHILVRRVDDALYAAKTQGRNRIVCAPYQMPTSQELDPDGRFEAVG